MRLRIAPSPTGMLHVGNARAALFNWLHARRYGGTFVLRIEDTDAARNQPEWIEMIQDSMRWLGLDWDEGPYFQSANAELHAKAGKQLFDSGAAYYCECSKDDVIARTGDKNRNYDGYCRERKLPSAPGRALRFAVTEGTTVVRDLIRGDVSFPNQSIDDFAVLRSDGSPLYLLANVMDDVEQRISHVVRGEEHLPNTPKQIMLWSALSDQPLPVYAHLPLIVNESGKKVSKRRDKVAVEQFRTDGYLPEAMRNYLALLGWAPSGDEITSIEHMISEFDLSDVQPSPARFDVKKLDSFNGTYIRELSLHAFVQRCEPFLAQAEGELWEKSNFDAAKFAAIAPLVQTRVSRLDEVPAMVAFFFVDDPKMNDDALAAVNTDVARAVLEQAAKRYIDCQWSAEVLHQVTLEVGEANGLKLGKAQAPIRVAVTGSKVGPPLFEALELLGRDESLRRMDALVARIS